MHSLDSGHFLMSLHSRWRGSRYWIPLVCWILSTMLRAVLPQGIINHATFITFYPAVLVSALYGGFVSALIAGLLSAVTVVFWADPIGHFYMRDADGWVVVGIVSGGYGSYRLDG